MHQPAPRAPRPRRDVIGSDIMGQRLASAPMFTGGQLAGTLAMIGFFAWLFKKG